MLKNMKELAVAYGWQPIDSKNKYMISFVKGEWRLNIYFTTMTVTKQSWDTPCKAYKDVYDLNVFEDLL